MKKKTISLSILFKYGVLILGAVVAILPILVVFLGSMKSNTEFLNSGVLELPKSFDLSNYKTAFVNGQMLLGFRNTLFIFVVSMIGKLTLGSMFAYVMSRFTFRFKKSIFNVIYACYVDSWNY